MILAVIFVAQRTLAKRHLRFDVISAVPSSRGIVGRRRLVVDGREVIVLRQPLDLLPKSERSQFDDGTNSDALTIHDFEPTSPWYVPPDQQEQLTRFNCATFAVGDSIGLTSTDWLEPNATSETRGTSPLAVVLDKFYSLVETYSVLESDVRDFESSADLRHDDVVVFVNVSNDTTDVVHLGRVLKKGDRNLVISKIGSSYIVSGSIQSTLEEYGSTTGLLVYRRN